MKVKASYRYQLYDVGYSTVTFYIIYLLATLLLTGLFTIGLSSNSGVFQGGQEVVSAIFIFVVGLCTFKDNFRLMLQNGVSRRSAFLGHLCTALTVALGMALVDQIVTLIYRLVTWLMPNIRLITAYGMLFGQQGPAAILGAVVFSFAAYLALFSIGYCISILFYRLGRLGKVLVGAGVPVFLFIIFPTLDGAFTGGKVTEALWNFLRFIFGANTGSPLRAVISFLVIAAIARAFAWLLMRRAEVK